MKIVFDFGGVVFRWHPASFLARVWPHRIETLDQTLGWVKPHHRRGNDRGHVAAELLEIEPLALLQPAEQLIGRLFYDCHVHILNRGCAEIFCDGGAHLTVRVAAHVEHAVKPGLAQFLGVEPILSQVFFQQVAGFVVTAHVLYAVGIFFNARVGLVGGGGCAW